MEGGSMGDDWLFHALLLLGLLWLSVMLSGLWPRGRGATGQMTPTPAQPISKRCTDAKPFPGLTTKPPCEACEHVVAPYQQAPMVPTPLLMVTRGQRRALDTQQHFCPDHECPYYG